MISATGLVHGCAEKGGSMPSIRVRPVQLTILVTVCCFSPIPLQHRLMSRNRRRARRRRSLIPPTSPIRPRSTTHGIPGLPGTQFTLAGEADRGEGLLPHRVVSTVTDLTKMINGVRTVVIVEKDVNEGDLQEAELRFQAQDNAGNIWNLGEYPEEYEEGKFSAAPDVWLAGIEGAEAGNSMLGDPQLGTPEYLQGWSPDIEFLDCAKVSKMQQQTCAPVGCYENVMIIDERSPLEPESGHQLKYHAPGVGNVRVGFVDDPEGEVLVLVKGPQLSPEELIEGTPRGAEAREARIQDQQAVSPDATCPSRCPALQGKHEGYRRWATSRWTRAVINSYGIGFRQRELGCALAGEIGSKLPLERLIERRHWVDADVFLPAGEVNNWATIDGERGDLIADRLFRPREPLHGSSYVRLGARSARLVGTC